MKLMKLCDRKRLSIILPSSPKGMFAAGSKGLVVFFCTLLSIGILFGKAHSADQDISLFLPLKINAAADILQLQQLADVTLAEQLEQQGAADQYILISRSQAQEIVNYQVAWPPAFETIQSLQAVRPGVRYVAAGSLTKIGQGISIDIKLYDLSTPSASTYYYREGESLAAIAGVTEELVADITAYMHRDSFIAVINVKGNVRIDSGAIRRQISSRAGDPYSTKNLNIDLKNVYKMGYFDEAIIDVIDSNSGKEVTFEVKEKPIVGQILIEGNKELEEEKVLEIITVASNTIINPKKVKESVTSIITLYKEKGYYNTEVNTESTYPKPGRVDVRFVIQEGPKIYTKEIRFVGNKAFKKRKLKKVIESSSKGLFSFITESGLLKKDVLELDVARLSAFYHNHGYIEAKVGEPEIVQEGKWLYVTFNIFEGERYRVGTVDLSGDLVVDKNELLSLIELPEEEYLSRKILREDILRLTDFYAEHGYAFAEVNPAIKENEAEKTVDIAIHINKGDLVHINRIIIRGNTRTRDKVIRRELVIKEKDIFNSKALRTSHEELQRLDYFEEININPEATLDANLMDVILEVKEKPTGSFSIGAGYSTAENFMFMGEISQNNFLGKGQRLALSVNLSGTSSRYNLSFTEPRYKDSKLLVGMDLYNWEREYDDYTKDSVGGAIRFGYPIWGKWHMGLGYGYDDADLTDILPTASIIIKDSADIHITSFVTVNFTRDTRNRRYNASRGSRNILSSKIAGGLLGGDAAFTKVEGSSSWYFPFYKELTFHVKGAAGQVFENPSGKLPVFEKFYLGGLRSIRGFPVNNISPIDPVTGDRIGGTKMWYTNIEWLFPVLKDAGLSGVIFFDAGNVYEEWDFKTIKKSAGGGFRWLSPMGPLRLEYGYVINPDPDEDSGNWDFSIGTEF